MFEQVGPAVLTVAAAVFAWNGVRLRSSWGRPGGRALVAFAALYGATSLAQAVAVATSPEPLAVEALMQVAITAGAVCWVAFVAGYTGRDSAGGRIVALASVVPAVGCVMALSTLTPLVPLAPSAQMQHPALAVALAVPPIVAEGIYLLFSLLLVWDASRYASFERTRGLALAAVGVVAGLVPLTTTGLELSGAISLSTGGAVSMLVLAAVFTVGIGYGRPYRSLPITEAVGREAVVSTLDDAVVVVDDDARIVDMNPAAESAFDRSLSETVREPLSALFDAEFGFDGLPVEPSVTVAGADGQRHYEVSVSAVDEGERGASGHVVAFRDVTDERVRRQRLEVLQRVLRHDVRNDMTAVYGLANAAENEGAVDVAADLRATADSLLAVSERARSVERSMDADPAAEEPTDVATLVERCGESFRDRGHDVRVTAGGDCEVYRSADLLKTVCDSLLGYATANADAVAVSVGSDGDRVVVTAEGDDPFAADHDVAAVESGAETQLEHADDMDIWAVSWAVDRLGGELSFAADGTAVTVRLPVARRTE